MEYVVLVLLASGLVEFFMVKEIKEHKHEIKYFNKFYIMNPKKDGEK